MYKFSKTILYVCKCLQGGLITLLKSQSFLHCEWFLIISFLSILNLLLQQTSLTVTSMLIDVMSLSRVPTMYNMWKRQNINYFCINKTYIKAIMQQITTSSNKERLDDKDFVNKYITHTIHQLGKIKKVRQSGRYEN